jgi:3-oxoacyl-(acyl-carrier-protein) synthase
LITQFGLAAALEALGPDPGDLSGAGVVVCVFSGCVSYSRRFYDETLKNPATASPLVFPETVFNAPASHISAYLGSTAINYTLVGDSGAYFAGLALAAGWIAEGRVSRCLVIGAEEVDWLAADALRLFDRSRKLAEGAGALLLEPAGRSGVELRAVTDEHAYGAAGKAGALAAMRAQLGGGPAALLCDSVANGGRLDAAEAGLWRDWPGPRISPKRVLGEGLMAAAAWQAVAAVDALETGLAAEARVSVAGFHQHAIGAVFARA